MWPGTTKWVIISTIWTFWDVYFTRKSKMHYSNGTVWMKMSKLVMWSWLFQVGYHPWQQFEKVRREKNSNIFVSRISSSDLKFGTFVREDTKQFPNFQRNAFNGFLVCKSTREKNSFFFFFSFFFLFFSFFFFFFSIWSYLRLRSGDLRLISWFRAGVSYIFVCGSSFITHI